MLDVKLPRYQWHNWFGQEDHPATIGERSALCDTLPPGVRTTSCRALDRTGPQSHLLQASAGPDCAGQAPARTSSLRPASCAPPTIHFFIAFGTQLSEQSAALQAPPGANRGGGRQHERADSSRLPAGHRLCRVGRRSGRCSRRSAPRAPLRRLQHCRCAEATSIVSSQPFQAAVVWFQGAVLCRRIGCPAAHQAATGICAPKPARTGAAGSV